MILRDRVTRVSLVRVFFPARRGSRARTPRSFPRRTSYHVFRRLVSRARRLSRRVPRVPRDRTGRRGVRGPFAVPRRSRRRARRGSRGGRPRGVANGATGVAASHASAGTLEKIVVEEPTRGEFGGGGGTGEIAAATRGCASPELGWATRAWTRAVANLVRDAEEGVLRLAKAGRAGGGVRRGDGRAAGASARTVQEVELRAHVRARAAGRASRATRAAATHPVRQAERLHDKTGARANGRLRARGRRGNEVRRRVRRVASNATKGPRASSPRRVLGVFARAGTSRREKAIGRTTVRGKISSSGIPTTGDAARVDDAARRRATDPRHAGYRHPREPRGRVRRGYRSADGREPCDRGGTAGRRRGPETSSSGWDPRRRRARWWRAAVARARRRCRRSHEREWTPSGMPCAKCSSCRWSSAMDVLPIVGGKARGFEQRGTRCIKIGGKITLNYSMTGYPYEKFSHPTTACFVSARPTVPSCLMSAPSAERRWSRRST